MAVAPTTPCPAPSPQITRLVADLDADADPLHGDYTPAVHALVAAGLAGACAVLDPLIAADADTRLHAARVLEGVLMAEHGWRAVRGAPHEYTEEQSRAISLAIGYEVDGAPAARAAAAARWRSWVEGSHAIATPIDGPPPDEMTAALDQARPALAACGEPVDLTVTFDRSGAVSSIFGTASTTATYRTCLAKAAAAVKVRPFVRASVWVRYPWQ